MYKVGICGHFRGNREASDGQTVKTRILAEELEKTLGSELVDTVDTYGWKSNPILLIFKCYILIKSCANIIILPAHNGIKVFVPLYLLLNQVFHIKLHYMVIGGWLPSLLKKNPILKNLLKKFDAIYVETKKLSKELQEMGLANVKYLPNFKRLEFLDDKGLEYPKGEPYKLCTFSRVMKEKGIEDAIDAVKFVNQIIGRHVYTLDIYGELDDKYRETFENMEKDFPEYINYRGIVSYNDSVRVLKEYFLLLFPTYFKTEGIPGTIIDAYAAGVPVIASEWNSANDIIIHNSTGFVYDFRQRSALKELLIEIYKKPQEINKLKKNCIERAKKYAPERVINELIKYL